MAENPYDVLGITTSATPADVKRAYRRKVLKCHPDAVGAGCEGEFRRVQQAYEEIGVPRKGGKDAPSTTPTPRGACRSAGRAARSSPQLQLELDRVEAKEGLTLVVPFALEILCPYCGGFGLLRLLCSRCHGWGLLGTRVRVRVDVPPGIRDGDVVHGYHAMGGPESGMVEFLVRVSGS